MIECNENKLNGPYELDFANYAFPGDLSQIPEKAGIYCLYSIKLVDNQAKVDKLEYIGKALNLKTRISQHCVVPKLDAQGRPVDPKASPSDYLYNHDNSKAKIFYTYALLDGRSIDACEAAMIKQFKPEINSKFIKSLGCHESARIVISGKYTYAQIANGTYDVIKD